MFVGRQVGGDWLGIPGREALGNASLAFPLTCQACDAFVEFEVFTDVRLPVLIWEHFRLWLQVPSAFPPQAF